MQESLRVWNSQPCCEVFAFPPRAQGCKPFICSLGPRAEFQRPQGKLGRGGQAFGEGRRLCQTPYAFSFDHLSRPTKEMALIGVTDEETEAQVGDVTYWPGVRQSKDEFTPANSKPHVFASKHELSAQLHTV